MHMEPTIFRWLMSGAFRFEIDEMISW